MASADSICQPMAKRCCCGLFALALEADGSIAVGGTQSYTASDGTVHKEMLVGHLTAGGAADTSFGPNGTGFAAVGGMGATF